MSAPNLATAAQASDADLWNYMAGRTTSQSAGDATKRSATTQGTTPEAPKQHHGIVVSPSSPGLELEFQRVDSEDDPSPTVSLALPALPTGSLPAGTLRSGRSSWPDTGPAHSHSSPTAADAADAAAERAGEDEEEEEEESVQEKVVCPAPVPVAPPKAMMLLAPFRRGSPPCPAKPFFMMCGAYVCCFAVLIISLGVSMDTEMDESTVTHSMLATVCGVAALLSAGLVAFLPYASPHLFRLLFVAFYAAVCFLVHSANSRGNGCRAQGAPALAGQLQACLLCIVFVIQDVPLAVLVLIACGGSWIYAWVDLGYKLETAYTSTSLVVVWHVLAIAVSVKKDGPSGLYPSADSPMDDLTRYSPSPLDYFEDGEGGPGDKYKPGSRGGGNNRGGANLPPRPAAAFRQYPSDPSMSPQASLNGRPTRGTQNSFFVASLETIGARLPTVNRVSMDGTSEISTTLSPRAAAHRGGAVTAAGGAGGLASAAGGGGSGSVVLAGAAGIPGSIGTNSGAGGTVGGDTEARGGAEGASESAAAATPATVAAAAAAHQTRLSSQSFASASFSLLPASEEQPGGQPARAASFRPAAGNEDGGSETSPLGLPRGLGFGVKTSQSGIGMKAMQWSGGNRAGSKYRMLPPMIGMNHVKRTAEETRLDAQETMDIVKSVVELDLDEAHQHLSIYGSGCADEPESDCVSQTDTMAGLPGTMKYLSSGILHKLVLLFARLSEELDTYRIQRFICACVVQVLRCEKASIFLCDWKQYCIWTISEDGHEIRVPMHGSLAGFAALHGRILNIRDAYRDPRFNKEVDRNTGYFTRNLLVYPISRGMDYVSHHAGPNAGGGNIIAVVEAINKERGTFTQEDEGVLALLGKQAGIHLSNAQVYQQLQLESIKTQSLLEVSKEINDVQLDLGAVVSKIMARARQVLFVERASIFLIDEEKKELWSILTDSETAAQIGGDNVIRLPIGVGLAGHVAATGNVLNVPDAYACDLFNPEFDRKTGFITKATLCVPVKPHHANKVMGVIQFINKCDGEAFHDQDVELALSFSSFVGISLNNILLYAELREGQFIREKNKELVRLRDQAKQAAEAKSNFLMAMSHEIRTPMSGVVGMCELLMNTTLTGEQKEMADTIRSCGEALMAIINDVLDYGRLEAGKLELEKRAFGLSNIIEETIDVMRPKSEAKSITLLVDVDPTMPTEVVGDQYRLRQVLTNLLGNAVKFTPDGGDITLKVERLEGVVTPPPPVLAIPPAAVLVAPVLKLDGDADAAEVPATPPAPVATKLKFSVIDTGIGICEEAQRKLFRPFEQADAGTTRQYGGSGLGLAICKQLVESMDGEIDITSGLGRGSTFWFTASCENVEGTASVLESVRNIAGGTCEDRTVLLAISHEKQRNTIARFLESLKPTVVFVSNYRELRRFVFAPFQSGKVTAVGDGRGERVTPAVKKATGLHAHLPHHLLVDDELEGLTSSGIEELRAFSEKAPTKVSMLMSMRSKASFAEKDTFYQIFTKPVKLALFASLFSEKQAAKTIQERSKSNMQIPLSPRAGAQKVLVAEDNATNQLLIKKQLSMFGIQPTVVDNGLEAVNALMTERYGLVFMDCHMPVLDGYGAVREIRKREGEGVFDWKERDEDNITIVALTADALPHTRGQCVEAGMDDYITKPLKQATLKKVLEKYYYSTAKTQTDSMHPSPMLSAASLRIDLPSPTSTAPRHLREQKFAKAAAAATAKCHGSDDETLGGLPSSPSTHSKSSSVMGSVMVTSSTDPHSLAQSMEIQ